MAILTILEGTIIIDISSRGEKMKTAGIIILYFLLFTCLCVFGIALTVNSTLLNPRFISAELNNLDISGLVEETLSQTGTSGARVEVRSSLITAIDEIEPAFKDQCGKAVKRVYDYISGKEQALDLAQVLRETVLSRSFISTVTLQDGIKELVREEMKKELLEALPAGERELEPYLDKALPAIDPWLIKQIDYATGPAIEYILGDSETLNITIQLEPLKDALEPALRDAFVESPPGDLAGTSSAELNSIFDGYYRKFSAQMPAAAVIDEASLGITPDNAIADYISDTEDFLRNARTPIRYFRTGYMLLIAAICIIIPGIVLIYREVRGATREIGIIFITYGSLEYLGIIAVKYIARNNPLLSGLPASIRSWYPLLIADFFRPLEIFSLVLGISGIVLIAVSIVYHRRRSGTITASPDHQH